MRTGTVSFNGKKHVLCFSVRVVKSCMERYGAMSGIYEALSTDDETKTLDEALWILEQMMKAGSKYAEEHGLENEPPMTVEDMLDQCDLNDFLNIRAAIISTINNGKETRVKADSPNAEATQGN